MRIKNCAFLYGEEQSLLMILDGELPENQPTFFRLDESSVHIYSGESLVFTQGNLVGFLADRLRQTPELGLIEMRQGMVPPHITKVAYQMNA